MEEKECGALILKSGVVLKCSLEQADAWAKELTEVGNEVRGHGTFEVEDGIVILPEQIGGVVRNMKESSHLIYNNHPPTDHRKNLWSNTYFRYMDMWERSLENPHIAITGDPRKHAHEEADMALKAFDEQFQTPVCDINIDTE